MSDRELFPPDNFASGWNNVLLAQKINKRGGGGGGGGVAIRMSWYRFFEKINSRGASIPDWRVVDLNSKYIR